MTTTNTLIKRSNYAVNLKKDIGHNQYKQQMAEDLALNAEIKLRNTSNLINAACKAWKKHFFSNEAITEQVKKLQPKIYCLILTEPWCGDASQTLPAFNKLAELSEGKIEMKLVCRDQNDELMNAYLTNGTLYIPKLIQLSITM